MALSILHRATGVALYAGTALLAAWLVAIALGASAHAYVQNMITSPYGQIVLFLYCWAFLHHLCGGIRHFIWDMGFGFQLRHVEWLARLATALPIIITLLLWRDALLSWYAALAHLITGLL